MGQEWNWLSRPVATEAGQVKWERVKYLITRVNTEELKTYYGLLA